MTELQAWFEERKLQGAQMDGCVFGNAHEDLKTVPLSVFTNEILVKVTGVPKAQYHQLRHAFGSWLFLALMLSDLDPVPNLFWHLHQTSAWIAQAHTRRQ